MVANEHSILFVRYKLLTRWLWPIIYGGRLSGDGKTKKTVGKENCSGKSLLAIQRMCAYPALAILDHPSIFQASCVKSVRVGWQSDCSCRKHFLFYHVFLMNVQNHDLHPVLKIFIRNQTNSYVSGTPSGNLLSFTDQLCGKKFLFVRSKMFDMLSETHQTSSTAR